MFRGSGAVWALIGPLVTTEMKTAFLSSPRWLKKRFFSFASELVFFFKWLFSLCVVGAETRASPCWMLGLDLRLGIWSSSTLVVAVGCFSFFFHFAVSPR